MKLFLDDLRDPPDDTWIVIRDVPNFLHLARHTKKGDIISLDHDLGEDELTGYDAICQLEKEVVTRNLWSERGAPLIEVHSDNPPGAQNIKNCISSIYKFLNKLNEV